ncbi:MAG: hypothetical protein JRJ75_10940 [Deltaproteobacteria bacterium]|nr:hypothetical protein [Deltaproteobacteria bacterium]
MAEKNKPFENVEVISKVLKERYGNRRLGNKKNPFNELLYIILSSKTPPHRYQETYRSLRKRFPRSDMLAKSAPREIETVIKKGGLAKKKGDQISAIARQLKEESGRVSLAQLRKMNDHQAEAFLKRLPGVGIKVARCILLFSLNRDVFPVDAHCLRIASRIGWLNGRPPISDRIADEIQEGIPRNLRRSLHISFVLLGRELCSSSNPRCWDCPIGTFCETGKHCATTFSPSRLNEKSVPR